MVQVLPAGSLRPRAPRLPERIINRRRLAEQRQLGQRPVSLVCAPAGYGKSTLVADWARSPDHEARIAWVVVDERHDEPFRFWTAVIDAIAAVSDKDVADVLGRLRPPQRGTERGFVSALLDVLESVSRTQWLVLDDVHLLRSGDTLAACDDLIGQASDNVRFILIGRSDPMLALARLRVSGELAELRAAELAFTVAESKSMLAALGISLDDDQMAKLHERTEGWVAGLRLAALSLTEAADPGSAVASFTGDQRAVADYLFAEVLRQLPTHLREFLFSTCAPEQLNPDLARHLSGRADAGEVLEDLNRANALVSQLVDPSWYRYHALLRSYLAAAVARQDADALRRQHCATADWLQAHGRPRAALTHAVEGADPAQIIEIVEAHGLELVLSGESPTVSRSISNAPSEASQKASVATIAALAALDQGDLTTADARLAISDPSSCDDGTWARLHGTARVQRALLGGDVPGLLAQTGMTAWPPCGVPNRDLLMLASRGPARMRNGDYVGAIDDLEHALELARHGGYDELVLSCLSQLSGVTGSTCDFAAMKTWSYRAIEYARPRGWADSPRLAYAYLLAAWTGFQTGDLDAQTRYAERGLDCLTAVINVEVDLGVRSMAALAAFEATAGSERYRAASRFHDLWQAPATDQISPALNGFASPHEVRIALAVGETGWAADAVDRIERQLPRSAESIILRATVSAARGRAADALAALRPILRGDAVAHVHTTVVAADLLAWQLYGRAGNSVRAHDALTRALIWAAPRNYRRPFLELGAELLPTLIANAGRFGHADSFVEELLRQINNGPPDKGRVVEIQPALTPKELEILRDLPSPLSATQIAENHMISINTLKTHVAAIYRKLGVPGRRESVLEARRLGLI